MSVCAVWKAIIQNVTYKPHPWDNARDGTLQGVDVAVRAIRAQMHSAIVNAYVAGAEAVHANWQEDRDPDFSEAAQDYARDVRS